MKRVYFLRPVGKIGPIKIGCSESPKGRAKQISCDRKERVRVITDAPGTFTDEVRLHRQFADTRVEGEWFAPTDALMAVIDHVLDTGKLPPPLEEDRVVVMTRLYVGGATLQEIGDKFGMTRERVRQILRKHDCPSFGIRDEHKRKADPIAPCELEIARLYADGTRPKVLRDMFPGVVLNNALKRTGTPRKGVGHWNRRADIDTLMDKVVALYGRGLGVADIAREADLPAPCYVYRYLARAGLKPTRRPQNRLAGKALADAVEQYRAGSTLTAIAEKFDVASKTAREALIGAGVLITREDGERRRIAAVRAANARRRHGFVPEQVAA